MGFASLGFAVVGFIAVWQRLNFRAAAILGPALFLWGAAVGHIYQLVVAQNFAPGNVGVIFWSDLLIPLIGFLLLCLQWKHASD